MLRLYLETPGLLTNHQSMLVSDEFKVQPHSMVVLEIQSEIIQRTAELLSELVARDVEERWRILLNEIILQPQCATMSWVAARLFATGHFRSESSRREPANFRCVSCVSVTDIRMPIVFGSPS